MMLERFYLSSQVYYSEASEMYKLEVWILDNKPLNTHTRIIRRLNIPR